MRQGLLVVARAAGRGEVSLNLAAVDHVARRQDLEGVIAVIVARFFALDRDGLLQDEAVEAGAQRGLVVVIEDQLFRGRSRLLFSSHIAPTSGRRSVRVKERPGL